MPHLDDASSRPAGVAPQDLPHLRRCVELAAEAVEAGDFPFGSVLVAGGGQVLAEDRNREASLGDGAPRLLVQGPVPGLDDQVRDLHHHFRG